jgi:hypothetical protein
MGDVGSSERLPGQSIRQGKVGEIGFIRFIFGNDYRENIPICVCRGTLGKFEYRELNAKAEIKKELGLFGFILTDF